MADAAGSIRFFDSDADYGIVEGHLPHWMQSKTVCFITWRTWDSMPESVVAEWHNERTAWLKRHNGGRTPGIPASLLEKLTPEEKREYHCLFSARWEMYLDDCHGTCPLRAPECSMIVADSLRHFDGTRYLLTDFVVMPNHVHVLVAFNNGEETLRQCDSWKHFTAVQLNRYLNRKGRFWEPESFDHLVRSEEQWRYLRDYVADNPLRAKLRDGEFAQYSRKM